MYIHSLSKQAPKQSYNPVCKLKEVATLSELLDPSKANKTNHLMAGFIRSCKLDS
jgi:hypothetical protein